MKLYLPGSRGTHNMFVQPGREFPNADFVDADGAPILFKVVFKAGEAEVADNLGMYMLDRKMAQSSPIILPEGFAV